MVQYSRHARREMRLYGVTVAEVEAALAAPDAETPTHRGRVNAWKQRGGEWLRVTYIREGADIVIITATPRRKGPEV